MKFRFVFVLFLFQPLLLAEQDDSTEIFQPPPRDYGHDWKLGKLFAITPEDGVLIGAGPVLYEYGFRTFPYVYRMELVAGLTLTTGHFKCVYTLAMPSLTKRLSLDLAVQASELEVRNFYDYGNNSFRDEEKDRNNVYRVSSREYSFHPVFRYWINEHFSVGGMFNVKHFDILRKPGRHIDTVASLVLGDRRAVTGAGLGFTVDFRDRPVATTSGVYAAFEAWEYPDLFKQRLPFNKYRGDVRLFYSPIRNDLTFAVRIAGEKLSGAFPFYEAAYLGGGKNLRGYNLQRFGGDGSLFGSVEMRFFVARMRFLVPGDFGFFFLADAGRVWVSGSSPGPWHADAGGGIWLAPLMRELTLSVAVANSPEGIFVNGGFGFGF